jgi:hypothetical protein
MPLEKIAHQRHPAPGPETVLPRTAEPPTLPLPLAV